MRAIECLQRAHRDQRITRRTLNPSPGSCRVSNQGNGFAQSSLVLRHPVSGRQQVAVSHTVCKFRVDANAANGLKVEIRQEQTASVMHEPLATGNGPEAEPRRDWFVGLRA